MFNQVGKLAKGIITLALTGLMVVGCAADMGEVDLVQPDYIKKSDLLGKTWYYRRTVVDAPETQRPWLSIGTGDLFTIQRIKFDIQENMLVGYTDYEWVEGSEEGRDEGSIFTEYGNPLVAFRITKHFDIARKYNSSTGEPTNVVSENASDNEWFEREYIRVNWAANIFGHNPFILDLNFIPVTSSRWVGENQAPANPYRARLTPEQGYFDFTTAHTMIPDWYECLYELGFSWFDCGSGEARVRHSFMEMDEEESAGFQVLNYPDNVPVLDDAGNEILDPATGEVRRSKVFERFGYYRLERMTYDDYRALTESGRVNNIIRFNIWDKSVEADGTVIPYSQRTPKPIVYYLNWDFPEDLLDTAKEVATEWNGVFKRTVASLQDKTEADVPDMFILKQNSCTIDGVNSYLSAHTKLKADVNGSVASPMTDANLGNYCAALEYFSQEAGLADPFVWQQNGDARFNMLYWITQKSPAAFSGYGPMLGDPVTGLNVVSTANILGWTIDFQAARARDYIGYINGELTVEDLLAGNHMDSLMNSPEYMPGENINNPISLEEMNERANRMASPEHMESLESRFKNLGETPEELLTGIDNSQHFEERLARVQGTAFEREHLMRMEDMIVGTHGQWAPGDPITEEVLEQASPIQNMRLQKFKRRSFDRKLEERTFCPLANFDDALVGLAKELKDLTPHERFTVLRQRFFKAVALHEVGHNVGLRHNFEASYDALNYDKTFWELESLPTDLEKLEEKQPEYKYSSIMDYHGKVNGDWHGLGLYDEAAIKFGYGQILEVFKDSAVDSGESLRQWNFVNDYRKLPSHLNSVDTMYDRTDTVWDWTQEAKRKEAVVDSIESKEVPYLFCSDEYAGRTPTCNRFDFGSNQRELQAARYTRYKNYFIFSNYLNGRISLNLWNVTNRGYSYFRQIITMYQYMYLYRSMQDKMFDGTNFLDTDLGQDMATAVADGINMMAEVIAMPSPGRYYKCTDANSNVFYYPSWRVSYDSLSQDDEINHVGYGYDLEVCNRADRYNAEGQPFPDGITDDSEVLALGDAQPLFLDFTDDFVTWEWKYVGTYWDKMSAIQELTDPTARFFRLNVNEDWRMYSVSPIRLYKEEVMGMLSGIITYDRKSLASGFDPIQSKVIPKSIVDFQRPLGGASLPSEPQSAALIIPSLTPNLQRMAMLYGLALLTSPLDSTLDFAKHTRVVLDGGVDDVAQFDDSSTDSLEVASCTIPVSGMTFKAKENRNGHSIGYDLVNKCADAAAYLNDTANDYDNVRAAKDVWEDARDDFEAGGSTTSTEVYEARQDYLNLARPWNKASRTLTESEQILNYTRWIHLLYEHGAEL